MIRSGNSGLADRMRRAAMLDMSLYEEVEADKSATQQALIAVIITAVASGIGLFVGHGAIGGLINGIITGVLGWLIWSYVTYFVGTRLFGGTATPGELLRTIGFAQSPRVLDIFAFLPLVGGLIRIVVFI